jgi:hypothetical protein
LLLAVDDRPALAGVAAGTSAVFWQLGGLLAPLVVAVVFLLAVGGYRAAAPVVSLLGKTHLEVCHHRFGQKQQAFMVQTGRDLPKANCGQWTSEKPPAEWAQRRLPL